MHLDETRGAVRGAQRAVLKSTGRSTAGSNEADRQMRMS